MALSAEQRTVAQGMAGAVAFAIAVVVAAGWLGAPAPDAPSAGDRLAFALRCDAWAALAFLAGIAVIASQRFFTAQIDGSLPARTRTLEVHRAYLQNTTEQLLLLLVAHLAHAAIGPASRLWVLPVLVGIFLVARAAFWIGYLVHPPARAFGFAATFYPTAALLLYDVARIV